VRFDETHEKNTHSGPVYEKVRYKRDLANTQKESVSILGSVDISDTFSDIISGDYSKIPASELSGMIQPLEKFLEHAKTVCKTGDMKKVG
jgi:hypothetical protein